MKQKISPKEIALPINDQTEMLVGEIRAMEVLFFSEDNDLNSNGYKTVTERGLSWEMDMEGIITVDSYGCIEAQTIGTVRLTVRSLAAPKVSDTKMIRVLGAPSLGNNDRKPIVSFAGKPAKKVENLQKIISHYTSQEVAFSEEVPQQIKEIVSGSSRPKGRHKLVQQVNVVWQIVHFAIRFRGSYVLRTNNSGDTHQRDKLQYFMGNRYLPGDGKSPSAIFDDGDHGLWVVGDRNQEPVVSHIRMEAMDYDQKAVYMSEQTQKYVARMGYASEANWDKEKNKWIPKVSDNDGLWTSMYGVGELMRYAVTHDPKAKARAKEVALRSLKAVLMNAHVPGRTKMVDAKIRHLKNIFIGNTDMLSSKYLSNDAIWAIDNYAGPPASRVGLFGLDAGRALKATGYLVSIGKACRFTLEPINNNDWVLDGPPARSKRSLPGFVARSVVVPKVESYHHGGLWIHRNVEGGQKVMTGAADLYDYTNDEHPILDIGNLPLPKPLLDAPTLDGKRYPIEELAYKANTSIDEIFGHLFIYKIAFDVLTDAADKEIHDLVVQTVRNLALHYVQNGHELVDATGQGPTYGKTNRDFFNSDGTLGVISCLAVICVFKLAHYMTGEQRWEDEYHLLVKGTHFEYAELAGTLLPFITWLSKNIQVLGKAVKPTFMEFFRLVMNFMDYSNIEMAVPAFYLLFQMEKDPGLLQQYRDAIDGFWEFMGKEENPFYNYVYQLAYPHKRKKDAYGNDLLDTAAWALSRHPIQMVQTQAYFNGSRSDVLKHGKLSIDPNPQKILGKRTGLIGFLGGVLSIKDWWTNWWIDHRFSPLNIYQTKVLPPDERAIQKYNYANFTDIDLSDIHSMQPSTTYTLPYWFGVYHRMLEAE